MDAMILFENISHTDDPRQLQFLKAMERERKEDPELEVIPMHGFPASAPDLGWLQDQVEAYWKAGNVDDVYALSELVSDRIGHAVQRCTEWELDIEDGQFLTVNFETKDDRGHYEYDFACKLYDTAPPNASIGEVIDDDDEDEDEDDDDDDFDEELAEEAKALVLLAFRNGPLEGLHTDCSIFSDDEMKVLMKFAVDHIYWLLRIKIQNPELYHAYLASVNKYTAKWDDPEPVPGKP